MGFLEVVMPGLVPGIHVLRSAQKGVDGRDKPGHDAVFTEVTQAKPYMRSSFPQAGEVTRGRGIAIVASPDRHIRGPECAIGIWG
jgi:hypothetical protein